MGHGTTAFDRAADLWDSTPCTDLPEAPRTAWTEPRWPMVVLPAFVVEGEDWVYSRAAQEGLAEAERELRTREPVGFEDVESLIRDLRS